MILLIDNYDSFSYNLYQLLASAGATLEVVRNDALTVDAIAERSYEAIVLSPGPGRPADAGVCEDVVSRLSGRVPLLGVCLGHQAMCEAFGGVVTYAPQIMHGKSSVVSLDKGCPLFCGLGSTAQVGRYHSLAADDAALPSCLRVIARSEDGEVMAISHTEHPTYGLQFHPESILTPAGPLIAQNFMEIVRAFPQSNHAAPRNAATALEC